jgi:hypothetical protein
MGCGLPATPALISFITPTWLGCDILLMMGRVVPSPKPEKVQENQYLWRVVTMKSEAEIEKMVDKVLDLNADRDRAEDAADAAWAAGDLEKYEDLLRKITCLDGQIHEIDSKIDALGGL